MATRRACLGLATLLAVYAGAAWADTVPLPDDYVPASGRERFRLCRAAVLIELRAEEGQRTPLRPAVIDAMREQIDFIMAETIFNVPALNLEDGRKRLDFTERFVLDFGKTVSEEIERLDDPAERAPILLDCQLLIWAIMKERIDILMQWRRRALGLDSPFPVDDKLLPAIDGAPPPD